MRTRVLVLVLLATACGNNPVEEEWIGLFPGILKHYGDQAVIDIPEVVAISDIVTITVHTYGLGGGCSSKGETRVSDSGHTILIEPFDSVTSVACEEILLLFAHQVTATFSAQGMVFVELRGREWPENKPYSTRRRIFVR